MEEYRIERLTEKSLFNLKSLYKDCFNLQVSLDFLIRKYDTKSFGAEYIGYLAFSKHSNTPAAYYGVFPILCRKGNENILAAQSGDTMTHPAHQGKGLFVFLANETYELAKREGIRFVFGFPNKNSYPGFVKKLNWSHYADINNYVIKTGAWPIDKLAKKFSPVKWIYDKYVGFRLRSLLAAENPPNSIAIQHASLGYVLHDNNFYRYKTYFKQYCINLDGIRCVVRTDGRLWVGDLDPCSQDVFDKTLNSLLKLGRNLACSSVHFSVFNGLEIDRYLKQRYKASSTSPVGAIALHPTIQPEEFVFQALDFDTY